VGEALDTRSLVGAEAIASYTQNAEDVRLLRVFRDVSDGFYVDIGAGNPSSGSVTRLFYERGWTGINVEPGPEYAALTRERPRDLNVEAAVGEADEIVSFFVTYPDTSLSTLDLTVHKDVPHAIERHEEVSVRQFRLESILRRYAAGKTIHFLKIDVEGAERQVVMSCDWREFRPIVVVVESVESWSTSPTHDRWERILLDADYEFAAFDGVNRFYVDSAHRELVPALSYPISALDRYVPAGTSVSREQFETLSSENERLRHETARLRDELSAVYRSRTWRAGLVIAAVGRPAAALGRRVRRRRQQRPASPEDAYQDARREGQAWHFPSAGRARRDERSALAGLERQLGGPRAPLDRTRAVRLQRSVERSGWTDDRSLHDRRLTREERRAVIEVDAFTRIVAAPTGADRAPSPPANRSCVVVDARCLQDRDYRDRGVGAHARSVLRATRAGTRGIDLLLLLDAELPDPAPEVAALADDVIYTPLGRRDDAALFVELSPMTASSAPPTAFLAAASCRAVAVLYDVIPAEYPSAYLTTAAASIAYRTRLESLRHYDLLLAISTATADRCRRILGHDRPTEVTGVADPLQDVAAAPLARSQPFLLMPAGMDPRKNAAVGVAALGKLAQQQQGSVPPLIVTGKLTRSQGDALRDLARRSGLPDAALELAGVVEAGHLAALYESAELVLCPSLAEGFSIPVVEALRRDTPVVVSDIESHRELVGDGPWVVAAADVAGMSAAIAHVRANRDAVLETQRRNAGDAGERASVHDRVVAALHDLLRERRTPNGRPASSSRVRPRLALVTPFPPQQSGVADYTAFTFREVAKHADVDVYTAARPSSDDAFTFFPLSSAPHLDRRYQRVVSVVGNSHFHFPVVDLLEAFGGACIAHDATMVEAYGWDDPQARGARAEGSGYGLLARQASPLLVHGHALARSIADETGVAPKVVPFVPYRAPAEARVDESSIAHARLQLGLAAGSVHAATFGFVDRRTKGHHLVLGALAWLRSWGVPIHLHVVGGAPEGELEELAKLVGELEVAHAVTFHGRVPSERLELFLRAVDVAIQIRTSERLTLSGSVTDCFAFGAPTVTTDDLALELDAPSYVATVRPRTSSLLLAEAVESIVSLRRNEPREIDGERVAYLSRRSAATYASTLLASLEIET
jgi:FkbM family methyltransferase